MNPAHLTYQVGAERWRVERGADVLADYKIAEAGLPQWHETMSKMGEQLFGVVCRFYAIFEILTTTDMEQMRPWDEAKIAGVLKLKAVDVKDLLA